MKPHEAVVPPRPATGRIVQSCGQAEDKVPTTGQALNRLSPLPAHRGSDVSVMPR